MSDQVDRPLRAEDALQDLLAGPSASAREIDRAVIFATRSFELRGLDLPPVGRVQMGRKGLAMRALLSGSPGGHRPHTEEEVLDLSAA